jgi:hypothetical protein
MTRATLIDGDNRHFDPSTVGQNISTRTGGVVASLLNPRLIS